MEYVKLHLRDQENREEGEAIKLISLVRKKAEKNVSAEDAANMLEDTTQNIQRIMDVIREHPELNDEQVYYKMIELYL